MFYRTETSPAVPPGSPRPRFRLTMAIHSLRIIIYLNASEKFVDVTRRLWSEDFFGTLILADAAFRVYDRLSQFERCFEIAAMYGVDLQFGQARIVSGHQFLHEDILVGHRNIRLTE